MKNFSDLISSPVLRRNLADAKFVTPTPIQAGAIPPALEGRDVIATAQTGTGKTLAFALPVLESLLKTRGQGVEALILSPTRELAIQIHETITLLARGSGIRSAVVVGGMSERTQLNSLRQGARIVVATPGRLCDFLDRKLIGLAAVRMMVLDEADRMLDMGFLPAVESIFRRTMANRQTMFFSATIEKSVGRLIDKYLKEPTRVAIGSTTKPAEKVETHLYEVDQDRKFGLLHHLLETGDGSFLVFARTKRGAERLAKKLSGSSVKATAIHGDRTQNQRNSALKGFQSGQYRVLVATDVAARGIHVDNIAHVVNYDLPQCAEDFIHRIGRTGRAGSEGVASTFGTRAERRDVQNIERVLKLKLSLKETPAGLAREEKREENREEKYGKSEPRTFKSRTRRFAAAG